MINYTFVNMKGNFDNPSGEWNWVGDFDRNGSILTKEVTLAADTWYNFFMNINGTEMHNNSEFSRGDAPKGGFPAAEGTNCWMHSDAPGVYTFTWNHATQELTVTYPTIVVKGANAFDGTDVTLIPSSDGSTATNTIDFTGHVGEWYNFGVVLNGAWTGDNAGFTRADNSRTISGDQNMWFEIEDGTVDYVYTFTWTFATNTLTIGYPDAVPASTCTTVRSGMVVDNYYTICLPKAVTTANGASFWNMSNRGAGVAYLEEAELPLVAGRPYIIQAEAEELCVEYSGDDAAADAYGALHGTLAAMDQAALDAAGSDIYLLKNNELRLVSGQENNSLAANRAYIKYGDFVVSTPNPAPGRRVRAIPMQDQSTTGVENLNAAEAPVKTVIDGKMYILRGEHMFDATGRMVK